MTSGNAVSGRKRSSVGTHDRFVEATLELIAEQGGSVGVNLRAVSRRVGCAHTNVYNYFGSYGELRWAAFRRALHVYGDHLTRGLDVAMPAEAYLRQTVQNLAAFPRANPGLYRFIGSDPIDIEAIPADIMEMVSAMKRWFAAVVGAAAGPRVAPDQVRQVADIVLAYVDGEALNLINGRALADEDLGGRVVSNALHVFELLARSASDGRELGYGGGLKPPVPDSILGETVSAAS